MKLETATSGNEGIMEFWNAYCKVCQTKVDGIMQINIEKGYYSIQKLKIWWITETFWVPLSK